MLVIGMSRNETFLTNIASYCVLCLCTWQYQNFSWMYQQICFSFLSPPMCWNRVTDAAIHGIKIDLIQLLFYIYPCKHWNEVMKLLINAQQLVPSSNLYTIFSISVKVLNLNHICCYKWLKNPILNPVCKCCILYLIVIAVFTYGKTINLILHV